MELNVELLLGAKVCDVNDEQVGRIEEIRAERTEKACLVEAFLVGGTALIERLSAWTLVRPIRQLLHSRKLYAPYEIEWQDMDLSDPDHPKLRIARSELRRSR